MGIRRGGSIGFLLLITGLGTAFAASPEEARHEIISKLSTGLEMTRPLTQIPENENNKADHAALKKDADALKDYPERATPEAMRGYFDRLKKTRDKLTKAANFEPDENDDKEDQAALRKFSAALPASAHPTPVPQARPPVTAPAKDQVAKTTTQVRPPAGPAVPDPGRQIFDGAPPREDLPATAPAQVRDPFPTKKDCVALGSSGCVYMPPSLRANDRPTLLVYLRGHSGFDVTYQGNDGKWHTTGRVPEEKRLESSREAFGSYGLDKLAHQRGMAVLVTGASNVGVSPRDIERIEAATGQKFSRIFVAAHSGGYVGLEKTLDSGLPRLDRIVMLDNFYFGKDLANKIEQQTRRGTRCSGFFTNNREGRAGIVSDSCSLENQNTYGHFNGVNRCLGYYLSGHACPS